MFKYKTRLMIWGGLIAAILAVFSAIFISNAHADQTASNWLSASSLSLQKGAEVSVLPPTINGNIDCLPKDQFDCVVSTAYGSANTNAGVDLNNTGTYRTTLSYIDNRPRLIPIPASNTVINYTTEPPFGFYFYFTNNFPSSFDQVTVPGGETQYQINRPPDAMLADKDGHRLAGDYLSLSFSANGQWMVVSEPNVAMLRVNLQTFEVLPFAPAFNYTIGISPSPQTAITNDGRYAVVASKDFNRFNIYDLSACDAPPSTINGPVNCQSRDLQGFMQQQVDGFAGVNNLRFISNDNVSLYANYISNSQNKIAKFTLSPVVKTPHQLDYLAMGESYVSGEGAFNYQVGTDTGDNACHLSLNSYPLLLGHDLSFNSYHSIACSGAKIPDIVDSSIGYGGQARPKIRKTDRGDQQVKSILDAFSPGYIAQLDFIAAHKPKTITLSIGGNDIGFSGILKKCVWVSTCYDTYEDRLELVRDINSKFPALVDTYSKVRNLSPEATNIYIVGYPQIAKPGGDCAANVHLNSEEVVFAQKLISYLDQVIEQAAARAGVYYVDTQDALNGHRLCEAKPGSVAMNGLTAGTDFPNFLNGPLGIESFHPNALGHQLLENKLLASTHNLTAVTPFPNASAGVPNEAGLDILNAPHSGRAINSLSYNDDLTNSLVLRAVDQSAQVSGLKPNANFHAVLSSQPINLGNFSSGAAGDLSFNFQIPNNVPAGFHSLHVYGVNTAGEPVDIYKVIYVAASADDLDGDGIPNSSDPCAFIEPAGQDSDADGTDDSCDGQFSEVAPAAGSNQANPPSSTNQLPQSGGSGAQSPPKDSKPVVNISFNVAAFQPQASGQEIPEVINASFTSAEPVKPSLPSVGQILGQNTVKTAKVAISPDKFLDKSSNSLLPFEAVAGCSMFAYSVVLVRKIFF